MVAEALTQLQGQRLHPHPQRLARSAKTSWSTSPSTRSTNALTTAADQLHARALLRIATFNDIYDAALVLFGVHLLLIGYLAFVPRAAENEVLLRVHAAGLDRSTWHLMTGRPTSSASLSGSGGRRTRCPGATSPGPSLRSGRR